MNYRNIVFTYIFCIASYDVVGIGNGLNSSKGKEVFDRQSVREVPSRENWFCGIFFLGATCLCLSATKPDTSHKTTISPIKLPTLPQAVTTPTSYKINNGYNHGAHDSRYAPNVSTLQMFYSNDIPDSRAWLICNASSIRR